MQRIFRIIFATLVFIALNLKAGDGVPIISTNTFRFNTNLTVGSVGVDVVMLRRVIGVPLEADNSSEYFGDETKEGVRRFQTAHNIPPTGFVGPLTRAAINGIDLNAFVNIDRLQIAVPHMQAGYVSITVEGQPLATYDIEVSSDFKTWRNVLTFRNADIGVQVLKLTTEELSSNSTYGFLRLTRPN